MSRDGIGMSGWCAAPVGAVILARQKTKQETKKSTRPIPGNNQFPPRRRSKMVRDVNGRWRLACIAGSEPRNIDFVALLKEMNRVGPGTEPRANVAPVLLDDAPCPPDDTPCPPNNTPCPPDDTTPAGNSDSSIAYGRYLPRVTLRMFFIILITIIVFLSHYYPPSGVLHQSSATVGRWIGMGLGALPEDNVRDFKIREEGRPSNPTIYHQTQQSTSSIIMVVGQEVVPADWDINATSDTFNEPELSDLSIPSPDPSISDDEFMRRDFQRREEEFMRDWLKVKVEIEEERAEDMARLRATLLEWEYERKKKSRGLLIRLIPFALGDPESF